MLCGAVRTFLSQVNDRAQPIAPIPAGDLEFLSANGYVLKATKEDYDNGVSDVARLSQAVAALGVERTEEAQAHAAVAEDERREHSFLFHFEGEEEKEELRQKIQSDTAVLTREEAELSEMEANVNRLIQEKSTMDRMVGYDGGYLSLTGLGTLVLNDLNVRNYRLADQQFPDFLTEFKTTYAELRSIADKASSYMNSFRAQTPGILAEVFSEGFDDDELQDDGKAGEPSQLWGTAIGMAKLQGDTNQIRDRFLQALACLDGFRSTAPNKLMAAEIMTSMGGQDVRALEDVLRDLDKQVRKEDVPDELSAGIAATMMAGRKYDGTYPLDRFAQFNQLTRSYEAASILAVMNVPYDALTAKFNGFRLLLNSWGYMLSEDTEIASAFLAIGELGVDEVDAKLKYIVEQLKNYLEYPLVAAAILASIPVFEAHEVLDLMEKSVTLLAGYAAGLERSELVALAVRMVHGVRNEIVKEIDPTAKMTPTPVQFTYPTLPGVFIWYRPVIIAHAAYHSTFSGMGGFHPAHSHGVGGFAG